MLHKQIGQRINIKYFVRMKKTFSSLHEAYGEQRMRNDEN